MRAQAPIVTASFSCVAHSTCCSRRSAVARTMQAATPQTALPFAPMSLQCAAATTPSCALHGLARAAGDTARCWVGGETRVAMPHRGCIVHNRRPSSAQPWQWFQSILHLLSLCTPCATPLVCRHCAPTFLSLHLLTPLLYRRITGGRVGRCNGGF